MAPPVLQVLDGEVLVTPALVVEVLSPSSRTIDRETGPEAPRREEGTLRWVFPDGAEPLELDVAGLTGPL
jgi:hypothetical protein